MPVPQRAFLYVSVQPVYGYGKSLITWRVKPGFQEGRFFIYRYDYEGIGDGNLLNPEGTTEFEFYDLDFNILNRLDKPFYRIVCEMPGEDPDYPEEFWSDKISFMGELTEFEYGVVNATLLNEYRRMYSGGLINGTSVRILYFKPLREGTPCSNYDPVSDNLDQMPCEESNQTEADPENDCYGLKFKGGYAPPVQTRMEILKPGTIALRPQQSEGSITQLDEGSIVQVRLLSFPKPRPMDLIVVPVTDDRYLVEAEIEPFLFKGLIPIAYVCNISLLQRTDPAYRVPLPELQPEPVKQPPRPVIIDNYDRRL